MRYFTLPFTNNKSSMPILAIALCLSMAQGYTQEENPYVTYEVPFQNLLKFNRFLVNPTFSAVRESRSYLNFFHRSQAATFNDNKQDYFLSYSGRINEKTGLGFSLYNQQEGVISNLGAMANYAYGVRLSEKSYLTLGINVPYYQSTFDSSRAVTTQEDPMLNELEDSSIIAMQPGVNLSVGKFDVGVFAENLMDFNLNSGQMLTAMDEKTYSGHLQYTETLENGSGILEDARIMPLARLRKVGGETYSYGGGLIFDLPKLGWLQGGYDSFFGASVGTGFNLNKRLSFGYNIEKGLSDQMQNFGTTHEISLAFSFTPLSREPVATTPKLSREVVQKEGEVNDDYQALLKRLHQLENKYAEATLLLDELIFRQDSIEKARVADSERRFELVMRSVQRQADNQQAGAVPTQLVSAGMGTAPPESYTISRSSRKIETIQTEVVTTTTTGQHPRFNDPKKLVVRKMIGTPDIMQGHYIVANVFKTEKYLNSFMNELQSKGLQVEYFKNPENGLNYVYLAHYDNTSQAVEAFQSGLGGKYDESLWIMHVEDPRYSHMANLEFEE